jgi:hypothetical protein
MGKDEKKDEHRTSNVEWEKDEEKDIAVECSVLVFYSILK